MAAVMHATNGRWRLHETWQGTHSAYTFGMPRYGNFSAVVKCPSPYHIYVDADIVPTVPPRWLGFEECGSEYRTDGVGLERAAARETLTFSSWLLRLASGVGVREHSMELYRARVAPTFKTSLPY